MIFSEKIKYLSYEDWARLEYGRLFWGNPSRKESLLAHWLDERHPYCERFAGVYRPLVEKLLTSRPEYDEELNGEFEKQGYSLRVVIREIPPIFGSFFRWNLTE